MLRQFEQELRYGKGFGFPLEELVLGGVGDHRGLSVFFDAYLLQGQRGAGDVLREGFAGFVGMRSNPYRTIDTESRVLPVDEAGGQIGIDEFFL